MQSASPFAYQLLEQLKIWPRLQEVSTHADLPAELGGDSGSGQSSVESLQREALQAQQSALTAAAAAVSGSAKDTVASTTASESSQTQQSEVSAQAHVLPDVSAAVIASKFEPQVLTDVANATIKSGAYLRIDLTKSQADPSKHAGVSKEEWQRRRGAVVQACQVSIPRRS